MDNTYSVARRALSAVVATLTILWAAGAAAFAVPQMASAASAGDLIRGTSFSTVYFYGYDGSRYVFPNEKTYDTWFNGFSSVSTISDSAVAAIPVASSNVVYRPGSRFIKVTTVPDTFAVGRDGMIHWIETQEVATGLAGSDWNQNIDDVADAFFDNYTEGVSLTSSDVWDGALYMDGADYFVAWDGAKHKLSSAARSANNLENRFFLDGASIDDSSLDAGDDFTGFVCALSDASQSGDCTETPVGGSLSVTLASTTPAAANVPNAANHVVATTWKLTADQATDLSALTVSYGGLAATSAIETAYLYEGDARLDNGRSINSSTRTATFAGLNLHFSAGQTRYISAVVDMNNAVTSGTFRFGVAAATSVSTNGTASGSFPIWGNTHTIIDAAVGSLTIEQNGSQSGTATIGETNVVIGRFSAQADTSGDEDVKINAITVTVDGDVNANELTSYGLYQAGNKVATGTYLNKDLVLFSFTTPFLIEEGDTRNFEVRANVTGEKNDVINVYIENESDVSATGVNTGFGVSADVADYDGAGDQTETTLEGGDITLAFKGPVAQDVRSTANDHKFVDFTITASEATTVNSVTFNFDGTLANTVGFVISDIRLINAKTGTLLSSEELATNSTDQNIVFSDEFEMAAGETLELAVTADLEDAELVDGDIIKISLDDSTNGLDLEDTNGDAITDIVPSSGIAGKNQTVVDSGLTVALAGSPSGDKTVVRGAQDVTAARYNFSAADGGDIEVTDLTLTVYSDDGGSLTNTAQNLDARDYIETCSLFDGATLVDGPVSPETDETLLFENFSWMITGGADKTLSVVCDLVDNAPAAGAELAIAIASANDVEAIDDQEDTVTVSGTANSAPTTRISVENTGGLVATVSSSTPDESFVLTGSVDQSVSTFRFDASNEDFRVNNVTLVEVGGGNEAVESVSITYPMNASGATATRSVSLVGSTASFNNIGMYVKQNTPAYVTVKANIADTSRDNGDAVSNSYVTFQLGDDTDEFEAQGVASSELVTDVIDSATETTDAERHVVRETVASVAKAATSPSGALFNGDSPVFTFNVSASAGEDVVLDGVVFQLSGSGLWNYCVNDADDDSNLTVGALSLDRVAGATRTALTDLTWTLRDADWSVINETNCADQRVKYVSLTFDAGAGEVVAAGTTRSFEMSIDVLGALEGDSLQVIIPAESSLPSAALSQLNGAITATANTITLDSTTGYTLGTTVTVGTETMLVTTVNSGTVLTVVRGYAGTTAASHADNAAATISATSFLWQDDGTTSRTDNASYEATWGADLVQTLPARGNTLVW